MMSRAVDHETFEAFTTKYWLTGFVMPNIKLVANVHKVSPDSVYFEEYMKLTNKSGLAPLNTFQVEKSCHYVLLADEKVVSGLSVLFACIKRRPMSLCASVELIVSNKKGSGSYLLEMLRLALVKRTGTCFLLTQAANTHKAKTFWLKNACTRREAKFLVFMLFCLSRDYHICCDTTFMMMKL